MKVADRALVANMAPEYGATVGFFPIDEQTLAYLRETGRTDGEVQLVERYAKEQQLFRTDGGAGNTAAIQQGPATGPGHDRALPGRPKRPQDRVALGQVKQAFHQALRRRPSQRGFGLPDKRVAADRRRGRAAARTSTIGHGAVVIAAITSCTNTSNPDVMLAAGLLAKKAVERGLTVKPYVKTSLAPGSRVVTDYLQKSRTGQAAGAARLRNRRLRLHDLHRQQRAAARAGGQGGEGGQSGGGRRALRQPQLRGPHPSAGEGQLPGQPAAGRCLRPGRHYRRGLDQRAAGHWPRRPAGLLEGHLADRPGGGRDAGSGGSARDVSLALRPRIRRQPGVERPAGGRERIVSTGTRPAPTSRSRRSCSICRPSPVRSGRFAAHGCWRPSAIL